MFITAQDIAAHVATYNARAKLNEEIRVVERRIREEVEREMLSNNHVEEVHYHGST